MRLCLCLAVCITFMGGGGALADSSDLSGGVFIAHAPAGFEYTTDPPGGSWCAAYVSSSIDSCSQQINRVDSEDAVIWFVLAAWTEAKEWAGAELGLGLYEEEAFLIIDHGPCFPSGGLSIPTSGWPGPDEGIALSATTTHWTGSFTPLYWFAGYSAPRGREGGLWRHEHA